MHTVTKRSFCLFFSLLLLCLTLAGCYQITLKERQVDGLASSITLKLPGNLQKLDFPVPVDPLTQRYFKGSRLYGEIDGGLYIAIYTNSIDSQQMYQDLHLENGQDISQRLNQTAETASKAVLEKVHIENFQASQNNDATVSGQHAVSQTFTFTYQGKAMQAKLLGFASGADTWIVVVGYDSNKKDKAQLADEVLQSVAIK